MTKKVDAVKAISNLLDSTNKRVKSHAQLIELVLSKDVYLEYNTSVVNGWDRKASQATFASDIRWTLLLSLITKTGGVKKDGKAFCYEADLDKVTLAAAELGYLPLPGEENILTVPKHDAANDFYQSAKKNKDKIQLIPRLDLNLIKYPIKVVEGSKTVISLIRETNIDDQLHLTVVNYSIKQDKDLTTVKVTSQHTEKTYSLDSDYDYHHPSKPAVNDAVNKAEVYFWHGQRLGRGKTAKKLLQEYASGKKLVAKQVKANNAEAVKSLQVK